MGIILFLIFFLDREIKLPEEVISVSKMVQTNNGFIILDAHSQVLWQINADGEQKIVYDQKGSGPGQYTKLGGAYRVGPAEAEVELAATLPHGNSRALH